MNLVLLYLTSINLLLDLQLWDTFGNLRFETITYRSVLSKWELPSCYLLHPQLKGGWGQALILIEHFNFQKTPQNVPSLLKLFALNTKLLMGQKFHFQTLSSFLLLTFMGCGGFFSVITFFATCQTWRTRENTPLNRTILLVSEYIFYLWNSL